MAPVCQGSVSQRVLGLQNEALEDFAARFTTAKWVFGLRNGTHVPKRGFAAVKNFSEGALGAVKWFRRGGPVSQPNPNFVEGGF